VLSWRGEQRLARTHLLRATRIFPRHYEAWAFLGRLHWDEKRLPSAIAAYRRAIEIFPDFENGRWGLAKSLEASGDLAGALAQFDEGARRLPSSFISHQCAPPRAGPQRGAKARRRGRRARRSPS
jgi:tetratricopeptide (TPR) repeat protein